MPDREAVKKRLYDILEECHEILCKYKDLRANGMSKDEVFEATWNTRKQTTTEILELLSK